MRQYFIQSTGICSSYESLLGYCFKICQGSGEKRQKRHFTQCEREGKQVRNGLNIKVKLTSLSVTSEKGNALTLKVYEYSCTLP